MKEQMKPRKVLEYRNGKTRPLSTFPPIPNVITINEFQVLLTRITCLSSYSIGKRYLPYSSPHRVCMPHPISKWPARPLSHSLYPGYESGLRTPVQRQFSPELAHWSNSVSRSNKLNFPLILSHVWKLFSNLCPDHDIQHHSSNASVLQHSAFFTSNSSENWQGHQALMDGIYLTQALPKVTWMLSHVLLIIAL